jgi:hypothetical protein
MPLVDRTVWQYFDADIRRLARVVARSFDHSAHLQAL